MKKLQGLPNKRFDSSIVGKITKYKKPLFGRKDYVLVAESKESIGAGYPATLTSSLESKKGIVIQKVSPVDLEGLNEGDVVSIEPNGTVRVLWETGSVHNCFMLTDACNCKCIMCPQPPKKDNDGLHAQNLRVLLLAEPEDVKSICFTGGEPALFPDRLVGLMGVAKNKFPKTHFDVLTNGILFSDFDLAKKIAMAAPTNTTFCVSLHADVADIHEEMNGAKYSFTKVVKGIHNLSKLRQAIEIRPVVTKLNFSRLKSMSNYIYRNFPFTVHVAFMGMEIEGYAKDNYDQVWIDPTEYAAEVGLAAWEVHRRGMNVSIYNIPLCLLPQESWRFARKSISGWKNDYLDVCTNCSVKEQCCGIFTTSETMQSSHINPIDSIKNIN